MAQNKEKNRGNISTLTRLFLGKERGSVLRVKEAEGPQGETQAVCAVLTQVMVGSVPPCVTHDPRRSRQEAAAEYFLFLPLCRRQSGATLRIKEGDGCW